MAQRTYMRVPKLSNFSQILIFDGVSQGERIFAYPSYYMVNTNPNYIDTRDFYLTIRFLYDT